MRANIDFPYKQIYIRLIDSFAGMYCRPFPVYVKSPVTPESLFLEVGKFEMSLNTLSRDILTPEIFRIYKSANSSVSQNMEGYIIVERPNGVFREYVTKQFLEFGIVDYAFPTEPKSI